MPEGILILEPGDDRAKMIAKAMASQTANDILGILKNSEYTSSEIANTLSIPITTATYHIENLIKAEMIEVVRTRWSPKGREVKIYSVRDQLVIVAPGKTDIRSLILKYASLFVILMLATVILAALSPFMGPANNIETHALEQLEYGVLKAPAPPEEGSPVLRGVSPEAIALQSITLAFFGGGCVVLLVLLTYELYLYYRDKKTV
jgi:DNA-binding transcriptional ArsR family regulator